MTPVINCTWVLLACHGIGKQSTACVHTVYAAAGPSNAVKQVALYCKLSHADILASSKGYNALASMDYLRSKQVFVSKWLWGLGVCHVIDGSDQFLMLTHSFSSFAEMSCLSKAQSGGCVIFLAICSLV
jgi:hypothetical protein